MVAQNCEEQSMCAIDKAKKPKGFIYHKLNDIQYRRSEHCEVSCTACCVTSAAYTQTLQHGPAYRTTPYTAVLRGNDHQRGRS